MVNLHLYPDCSRLLVETAKKNRKQLFSPKNLINFDLLKNIVYSSHVAKMHNQSYIVVLPRR